MKAIEANLKASRCFMVLHYACRYALVCCAYARLNWATYIHEVYHLSSVFDVYWTGLRPLIPEGFWPSYDGLTIIPDPTKRRMSEGLPRTTMIETTMDEADTNSPKRCGLYRQPCHTRMKCPQEGFYILQ
ncbi:hypothetical protein AHAS_Ahas09G0106000 [Arachis hypogaea]